LRRALPLRWASQVLLADRCAAFRFLGVVGLLWHLLRREGCRPCACSLARSLGELRANTIVVQFLSRVCVVAVLAVLIVHAPCSSLLFALPAVASLVVSMGMVCVLVSWVQLLVSCRYWGCY
jgi:hypothetical protein